MLLIELLGVTRLVLEELFGHRMEPVELGASETGPGSLSLEAFVGWRLVADLPGRHESVFALSPRGFGRPEIRSLWTRIDGVTLA